MCLSAKRRPRRGREGTRLRPGGLHAAAQPDVPVRARGGFADVEATLAGLAHRLGRFPDAAQLRTAARWRRHAISEDVRLRPDATATLLALRERGLRVGLVSDCSDELPDIVASLPVAALLDAASSPCTSAR